MFIVLSEQKELVLVAAISGKTFYLKHPFKASRPADVIPVHSVGVSRVTQFLY